MITAEQNELMTRVGPGTAGGKLLRSYWQPAALVDELEGERPVRPVRLLGEDLVLFRDEQGRYGLLDRTCPHRRADLSYGRREDGGLRCAFHGWLFDVNGRCLDTPAEPEGSRLCESLRQRSYPVVERNGILWAYLGARRAARVPELDCFVAPSTRTPSRSRATGTATGCRRSRSGSIRRMPSFLHRFPEDEDPGGPVYGRQFRAASASSDLPMTRVLRDYHQPKLDHENTPLGLPHLTRCARSTRRACTSG